MSPRREEDDSGGPSDEEGSSASEQIQRTPSNIEPDAVEDLHDPATNNNDEVNDGDDNDSASPDTTPKPQLVDRGESSGGYVSFGGKSQTHSSILNDTPDDEESLSKPKSRIASKAAKGQVLVHYHPQLGDEGFESTLVNTENESLTSPSRGRPMDEDSYYSGAGGMNSRMMEDVRVGRMAYNQHYQPPSSPAANDEQNNAATRQIRRRVFRAALERGAHDERRKKMLDADADIGGPSLVKTATTINNGTDNNETRASSGDADDDGGDNIPSMTIKPSMSTMTPRSYETTPGGGVSEPNTISPPAPPVQPPSYHAIVERLIKDNEPQKLPQLDKVMKKYKGREEELITKLDARYKKRKQKSNLILQDLEKTQKGKNQPIITAASKAVSGGTKMSSEDSGVGGGSGGGSKQSLEEHGGIQQMNSWDSKKSKDVYFVKVTEPASPGVIKLPSDIIDSNKTAPHSNVRAALARDDDDGDIPAIPKCDAAPAAVTAAAAANEVKITAAQSQPAEKINHVVEKETTTSPASLQEPYKLAMAPSYGDGISVITMETKGTMKTKKNDRGEEVYSWLQRPPNSITVEGGSKGSDSPISPEKKSKVNKLLPEFDQEKKEDKVKAEDAKLETVALNNVEARIRARREIMEAEAKNKAASYEDIKAKSEKSIDGMMSKGVDKDEKSSIAEEAESFVGKSKPRVLTPTQEEEEHPSLIIEQEDLLLTAAASDSGGVDDEQQDLAEPTQTTLPPEGGDDVSEEEEISLLLKESRLQAEKAIALKKAQRELEKEKKARMEAEAARIKVEEELARLKAGVDIKDTTIDEPKSLAVEEEEEEEEEDGNADNIADEDHFKDVNTTLSSVSAENEQVDGDEHTSDSEGDPSAIHTLGDADRALSTKADASVGADEEHLTALKNLVLDGGGDDSLVADDEEEITPKETSLQDADPENEYDQVASPLGTHELDSPPSDEVVTKKSEEKLDHSLGQGAAQKGGHDFPSTTMVHAPLSNPLKLLSEQEDDTNKSEIDEDANINHVATMTFEGDRFKGQLSFTTGSKILAHSNQRGPWWLGRCGGRTGWFPANAVVPESEYLKNIAVELPSEIEESNENLGELSNEELAATYDLIRNPSDPIDDGEKDDDDDDDANGSPARSRWLGDRSPRPYSSSKNAIQSSRSESPPPTRMDPSKMEGLSEGLYEPEHESDAIDTSPQFGFEGMNRVGKSIEERAEDKPQKTYIGPPQVITETDSVAKASTGPQSKKKKQEWKAAQDPGTGLTYYYHLKTRETTWEKPPDYEEVVVAETKEDSNKGLSGVKILRMFSKKKKKSKTPKSPNEDASVTPSSLASPSSTFSFDEQKGTYVPVTKRAARSTENAVATRTMANNASGAIEFPQHDDDDDDDYSSDNSSLFSRENIFTKKKLKSAVGKFTDKVAEVVINQKASYEQLSGDEADGEGFDLKDPTSPTTSEAKTQKQVEWRSAIDAATGRTYYYVKGGNETFWEKPSTATCVIKDAEYSVTTMNVRR